MVRFTTFLFSLALLVGYQTAFAEKTRVGGSCENFYGNDNCEWWADQGYCSSSSQYTDWMEANCEQSCNMCGICRNNPFYNDNCEYWADSGYCSSSSQYSDWMEMYCEQSCNMCSPVAAPVSAPSVAPSAAPTTCEDTHEDCGYYRDLGWCLYPETSREWMETNCKLSCEMCSVPSCENAYTNDDYTCDGNAYGGYCYHGDGRSYDYWMYTNCKKSCKMCCKDPYNDCKYYADQGKCSGDSQQHPTPDWMAKHCKNTCSSTPCIS